jgi:hypothetical protein
VGHNSDLVVRRFAHDLAEVLAAHRFTDAAPAIYGMLFIYDNAFEHDR